MQVWVLTASRTISSGPTWIRSGPHRQEALSSASAQSSAAAIAATGSHHVLYKENAVTGETAPPRSTDLLLADDTRVWEPLRPIWQRLCLATICQLWAAYQRGRHQPDAHTSPGQLAARIFLQEGSPGRLATCHRQHPAVSGRAQRLVPGTQPHTEPGRVHSALVPPRSPLHSGRPAKRTASHPLKRTAPSAAARLMLSSTTHRTRPALTLTRWPALA